MRVIVQSMPAPAAKEAAPAPADDGRDLISGLPDELLLHVLSFLPTHLAARTSALSRRFRALVDWERAPPSSLDLDLSAFPRSSSALAFALMLDCALLDRDSSHRLLRLRLNLGHRPLFQPSVFTFGYTRALFLRAADLRVAHLAVSHLPGLLDEFLPAILSIASLRSLSLRPLSRAALFPASFAATGLTALSLSFHSARLEPPGLNPFLSSLPSLEDLELEAPASVDLRSETVRRLKLVTSSGARRVAIRMPRLEVLDYYEWRSPLARFCGDMPMLKRASIEFIASPEDTAPGIRRVLKALGNAERLRIIVQENYVGIPVSPSSP